MRLAVFADIHGNLLAFEAALAHARGAGVDQIVIVGDIVIGSPDSAACWQLARSLGCPILRGNHERYVVDYGTDRAVPIWSTPQFAPLHWAAAQLSAEERAALGALPWHLRLPDLPDLLLVHASLRNDTDGLPAYTPEAHLPAMFPAATERLIVRAHDHIGATYLWGERRVVTAGSVGLPLNGVPTAQYLLLERRGAGWHAAHQSVPYNLDAALTRFAESGYLAATGVMGRLYQREVATASFQIVPFLRRYQLLTAQAPVSLDDALAHYLLV
jgi:hypothetical protein